MPFGLIRGPLRALRVACLLCVNVVFVIVRVGFPPAVIVSRSSGLCSLVPFGRCIPFTMSVQADHVCPLEVSFPNRESDLIAEIRQWIRPILSAAVNHGPIVERCVGFWEGKGIVRIGDDIAWIRDVRHFSVVPAIGIAS